MAALNSHHPAAQHDLEQRLRTHYAHSASPEPPPEAVWTRLEARLGAQRPAPQRTWRPHFPSLPLKKIRGGVMDVGRWRMSLATVAVVALIAVVSFATRPAPASAQAILTRAQAANAAPLATSYHFHATLVAVEPYAGGKARGAHSGTVTARRQQTDGVATNKAAVAEPVSLHIEAWRAGPTRWRTETTVRDASAQVTTVSGKVQNGDHVWFYTSTTGERHVMKPGATGTVQDESRLNLQDLLDGYRRKCQDARLQDEASIAGRPAYVVELTPSAHSCGGHDVNQTRILRPGRAVVYLDKETFLVLKSESFAASGVLLARFEVTAITYGAPIADSVFAYTPSPTRTVVPVETMKDAEAAK